MICHNRFIIWDGRDLKWKYADFQLSLTDRTRKPLIMSWHVKITTRNANLHTMNESNIQYQFSLGNGLFFSGGPAGDRVMLISVRLGLTLVILQGGEASYYINQNWQGTVAVEASVPEFIYPIDNITVAAGRDAQFTCVVNNLEGHKVGVQVYASFKLLRNTHTFLSQKYFWYPPSLHMILKFLKQDKINLGSGSAQHAQHRRGHHSTHKLQPARVYNPHQL